MKARRKFIWRVLGSGGYGGIFLLFFLASLFYVPQKLPRAFSRPWMFLPLYLCFGKTLFEYLFLEFDPKISLFVNALVEELQWQGLEAWAVDGEEAATIRMNQSIIARSKIVFKRERDKASGSFSMCRESFFGWLFLPILLSLTSILIAHFFPNLFSFASSIPMSPRNVVSGLIGASIAYLFSILFIFFWGQRKTQEKLETAIKTLQETHPRWWDKIEKKNIYGTGCLDPRIIQVKNAEK